MAKVLVTGYRKVDFMDDKGKQVQGTSVYFKDNLAPGDLPAGGYTCGKVWLRGGTPLEAKMLGKDYSKPFECDFMYEVVPGRRNAVLVDII